MASISSNSGGLVAYIGCQYYPFKLIRNPFRFFKGDRELPGQPMGQVTSSNPLRTNS